MPREISWHIPTVSKYGITDATTDLNVVFLQRMTGLEQQQVEQALKSVDSDAVLLLNIGQQPVSRPLRTKRWIRDCFPSSATTLEIAKAAYNRSYHADVSLASLVFVDSGWDLGNVIAAHWEQQGEGGKARLSAARVSTGIANVLLTACDRIEGMTLSHALGYDKFKQSQVDLYKDIPDSRTTGRSKPSEHAWPEHLPSNMKLDKAHLGIISLRALDAEMIEKLKEDINEGSGADSQEIQIYNWEGPEPTDRLIIRDLYNHMRRNTEGRDENMYAWFIDYMLQGPNDKPQILAVSKIKRDPGDGVEVLPVFTSQFTQAWKKALEVDYLDEEGELVDIWKKEHVDHFNTANSGTMSTACPIFFLQPFNQEEERQIRASVSALGDVEDGQDWGHLFIWHGYIFNDDGKKHTLEELRDLFESSDPFSPSFDNSKAGSYRLTDYPGNFVAIDEKIFDSEPKVWMASSLDFHGEDTSDQLGWTIGRLDAAQTSIIFMNLDIANEGPDECFDEETIDLMWLSDLAAFREEDWVNEQEV